MHPFLLSKSPLSVKLFATILLICLGLTYGSLALHIFIDTEFKPALIKEAYSLFEWIELTDITHDYLPYYAIILFFIPLTLFIFGTGYSEKLKRFFPVIIGSMIILDIGSMWAIPYVNADIFAYALFFAGNCLALCFGTLFILLMIEIWFKK